jgi:hypothetical protein
MGRQGQAMNRWHNHHLNSPAHTLTATLPNRRPALSAPEPPFLCGCRGKERV